MDAERRRELKRAAKVELEQRSAVVHAALKTANPAPSGSDQWAQGYRVGVERERRLQQSLPILHSDQLAKEFVVHRLPLDVVTSFVGGYVLCSICGSAVPSKLRWKWIYFAGCACGRIRWRCFMWWRRIDVREPQCVVPVKLIGRA
jgi:hypothetical protein